MAITVFQRTHDGYTAALVTAAEEIKLRADDMVGEIDGVRRIMVQIDLTPDEIVTVKTVKFYTAGWKQRSNNNG